MLKELKEWALVLLTAIIIALICRRFIIEPRYVPTPSMVPTIMVDDRLYVEKVSLKFGSLERGNIVVFKEPETTGTEDYLVKRIIGLGGDTIEIKNGILYVNDNRVDEPYLNEPMASDFEKYTVPEGRVFLMGDNRNHSNDSRSWGTINESSISGEALCIYFPFSNWKWLHGQQQVYSID